MTVTNGVGPGGVAVPHSSGVQIIIVGLGIAGLVAAIECHYKGHRVIGLEKSAGVRVVGKLRDLEARVLTGLLTGAGDSIALGSNATRVLRNWDNGEVLRRLASQSDDVAAMEILDPTGRLYAVDAMDGYGLGEGMIIHRGTLVNELYEHAESLDIDLRFGSSVNEYWEDEGQAGVTVNGEQRIAADCVVGTDGVHSKAREAVLGYQVTPQPSGLAAYRACFSADAVLGDPEADWILEEAGMRDRMRRYITTGGLGLTLATGKRGQNIIWQVWHRVRISLSLRRRNK